MNIKRTRWGTPTHGVNKIKGLKILSLISGQGWLVEIIGVQCPMGDETRRIRAMAEGVVVYTFGVCHCSVCAPKEMPRERVELGADADHPTGLDHGWKVADEPFATGQPNPCPCNTDGDRLHYLMVC